METKIVAIDAGQPQPERIQEAARIIQSGGLVAFPTETVYGLGADALNPQAAQKIYAAKGRPSDNPLIAHIADFEELPALAAEISDTARTLMRLYWPGPLTLIFKKTETVPFATTGGLDTVAVRMPSHPVARALIRAAGTPIAAPSANRSGRPSPTKALHVREDLDGHIDMLLDGGEVGIGLESTIIDVSSSRPLLLRPGFISEETLKKTLKRLAVDTACMEPMAPGVHPRAPGMKYRHYAPQAPLTIVRGTDAQVEKAICFQAKEALCAGKNVGILCASESLLTYRHRLKKEGCRDCQSGRLLASCVCSLPYKDGEARLMLEVSGSRREPAEIAHHLYDALRSFDRARMDVIFSESFECGSLGGAIMNRLKKAAGYHILEV
ncbi:MAG: threonylcarbamoyl-AMP synthase [Lachnospiraceae bacterium]|nr:threonylcarbamoyl-AMP synthase [Lachnospiraceae bacterium]